MGGAAGAGRLQNAMKILYKPFALFAGVIGAKLGERVFKAVWAKIDKGEPPEPTNRDAPVGKAVGAAALEAATLAASKAAARRASARSFQYLFGVWPGAESGEETNK